MKEFRNFSMNFRIKDTKVLFLEFFRICGPNLGSIYDINRKSIIFQLHCKILRQNLKHNKNSQNKIVSNVS
jgi:hypothetical protein